MASAQRKDKGKEVQEPEHVEHSEEEISEEEPDHTDPTVPQASTPSTSSKKKKKKRSKAVKALNTLTGGGNHIPQSVVNVVTNKVRESGEVNGVDEATVRAALEPMKIKDYIEGKAGVGGKNKKETGGHKVRVLNLCDLRAVLSRCTVLVDTTCTTNRYDRQRIPPPLCSSSIQERTRQ